MPHRSSAATAAFLALLGCGEAPTEPPRLDRATATAFSITSETQQSGCTYSFGYWKKNNPWGALNFFQSGMTWDEVFNTPPRGNAYFIAAHQWMAAALNEANGAIMLGEPATAFGEGVTRFFDWTPEQAASFKGDHPLRASFLWVGETLDAFNTGELGPGACD